MKLSRFTLVAVAVSALAACGSQAKNDVASMFDEGMDSAVARLDAGAGDQASKQPSELESDIVVDPPSVPVSPSNSDPASPSGQDASVEEEQPAFPDVLPACATACQAHAKLECSADSEGSESAELDCLLDCATEQDLQDLPESCPSIVTEFYECLASGKNVRCQDGRILVRCGPCDDVLARLEDCGFSPICTLGG